MAMLDLYIDSDTYDERSTSCLPFPLALIFIAILLMQNFN